VLQGGGKGGRMGIVRPAKILHLPGKGGARKGQVNRGKIKMGVNWPCQRVSPVSFGEEEVKGKKGGAKTIERNVSGSVDWGKNQEDVVGGCWGVSTAGMAVKWSEGPEEEKRKRDAHCARVTERGWWGKKGNG